MLSPRAQKYLLAGAGGRGTVRANARAVRKWRIIPLMFRDHAERDLSTTVLGTLMPAPVLFAPVGRQKLAHPEGELASARAAAGLGLTFIHSAAASYSLEDVAAANRAGSRRYELKWPNRRRPDVSLLQRARAALDTHLVLTLSSSDANMKQLRSIGRTGTARSCSRESGRWRTPGEQSSTASRASWSPTTELENAMTLSRSLEALPAIVRRTGRRLSVLFDFGVGTAPDAFKALALGADAVLVGRPYVFGLALDGEAGVTHVMPTLLAELDISLGNAGYATAWISVPLSLSAIR